MKVLFFVGQLKQGGAERVVSIISNKLVERGFDVEVLSYYDSEINYFFDQKIIITKVVNETHSTNKLVNLRFLKKYFNNTDIIISFMAPFNILALLANRNNNVPIIVSDRNDPNKIPTNPIIRKLRDSLYKKANYVVVQTENNKKYFNYLGEKVVVINNPIDLKDLVGKALETKKEDLIVSVGRLKPQKNQLMLIKAFSKIANDYPSYKLMIYGEGPYRETLENRIKELNLVDRVLLPGEEKEVIRKILNAKLFVLPSNFEGMPNALMEAMCVGLPCISTKVSGANELIDNGNNGLLVDINDVDSLTKNMKLILDDETLSNKLATNAIKLNEELEVNNITDKWALLINKVVK